MKHLSTISKSPVSQALSATDIITLVAAILSATAGILGTLLPMLGKK
jgi:hypothetical protein